uniref:Uncharacterized protein n=1 Tax=Glossina pallidipes TaxID=7398 RepID=A0A1B0ADK0_GLOPL
MILKFIIYIVVLSELFRNVAEGRSLSGINDSETIDRNDNSATIMNTKNSTKADIVVSTTDRHNYSELVWEVFGKTIIKPQLISDNTTEEKNSSDNNPLVLDRRTIWSKQTFSAYTTRYTIYEELTQALKPDSTFKDVKVDVNAIEVTPTGVELSRQIFEKDRMSYSILITSAHKCFSAEPNTDKLQLLKCTKNSPNGTKLDFQKMCGKVKPALV